MTIDELKALAARASELRSKVEQLRKERESLEGCIGLDLRIYLMMPVSPKEPQLGTRTREFRTEVVENTPGNVFPRMKAILLEGMREGEALAQRELTALEDRIREFPNA